MTKKLEVGSRVRYSSSFLKNIGVHTGDMCFCVGTIKEIKPLGSQGTQLATVEWDAVARSTDRDTGLPSTINLKNLERSNR